MKILVYGAGVVGSLYAAKLEMAARTDVTILARGERYAQITEHGIVIENAKTGVRETVRINLTDRLEPQDAYDWVIVCVRKNQIAGVLPALAANLHTPNVLFLVNNAAGADALIRALGPERVVLGFPGAGGALNQHVITYRVLPMRAQSTPIGEIDGKVSQRLRALLPVLWEAGFPAVISRDVDAWLKTHVALVSPVANALYAAGGDSFRLARTRDALVLMVRAIREGFDVLRALGVPIEPRQYRLLAALPEPLWILLMQRRLATPDADLLLARHARHARDEMRELALEFRALARRTNVPTPAIDMLDGYVDPHREPLPEGAHVLTLDLRGLVMWVGSLAAGVVGLGLVMARLMRQRVQSHAQSPGSAPA
jgi:2-dehydropantoate 2-reductase